MSTRATYDFIDEYERFTVYKHHDGYPSGGLSFIEAAKKHAWKLPRFEASDFGAGFIVANKDGGGGVRLTGSRESHGDTEYHYEISLDEASKELYVKIHKIDYDHTRNLVHSQVPLDYRTRAWKLLDEGLLPDLIKKHGSL